MPVQRPGCVNPENCPWKRGDRFFIQTPQSQEFELLYGPYRKVFGTVLHRRIMYGDSFGGTYMVKFDDPTFKEHNAYGDNMRSVESAMEGEGVLELRRFR